MYKRNIKSVRVTFFFRGKAVSITYEYSDCVSVPLVVQYTKRICLTILLFVACPSLPHLSTLSHKRHDFVRNGTLHKIVFWFSVQHLPEILLIPRRIQSDIIINVHRSSCNVPFNPERFKCNLNFPDNFFLNFQIPNFMKFCLLGAKLFHPNGERIDITKLTIAYSNLCPKSHQHDMLHTLCPVWNLPRRKLCAGTAKVSRFVPQFRSHLLSVYNDLFSPTNSLVSNRIKAVRGRVILHTAKPRPQYSRIIGWVNKLNKFWLLLLQIQMPDNRHSN
jgi:hypothetical protein